MIFLILLCLLAPSYQQPGARTARDVDRQKLKVQAQELGDAMINGDYAHAVDLTYPKLVRLMGGRAQAIANMKQAMSETNTEQFRLSSMTAGEPRDIVADNGQYYAIVPTTMRFKVREGTLAGEAFMIGISTDGGNNWTFIDSGGRSPNKAQLKTLIGPAADKLQLPEEKRPVLYPNQ